MLRKIINHAVGLMHLYESTDRKAADCAEAQDNMPRVSLEKHIHDFLLKLDPHCYLKRYTDTWLTLKIMLLEGDSIKTMGKLYARVTEEVGGSSSRVERNLRLYRKAVEDAGTEYYRENIAVFNKDNGLFYWNAVRVLKEEWGPSFPESIDLHL